MKFKEMKVTDSYKINEINGEQYINRAWREIEGKRQLVEINYLDSGLPNGANWHINQFEASLKRGGKAFGCYNNEDILIGYAVLNAEKFGETAKYILLDQLFISKEERNKGIGKELFKHCCIEARNLGADKIYICAGSAEETVAFYYAIGCVEAVEINQELYQLDTRDFQMEYAL
ncbi:GNAT family N-acetyltransferase [Clostridium sp. Marseille-P299]|uniref:GNAT family N-acetyltransferase n=1 Tax=Clostridium sp. Marseille-P299 TaxID=1805477 RepID=UPI00082F0046|nr:GNAT family N-acetyltransferase [Clostridium sp. Marseille-P299]